MAAMVIRSPTPSRERPREVNRRLNAPGANVQAPASSPSAYPMSARDPEPVQSRTSPATQNMPEAIGSSSSRSRHQGTDSSCPSWPQEAWPSADSWPPQHASTCVAVVGRSSPQHSLLTVPPRLGWRG